MLNTTFAINNTDKMNLLPEKPNYMVPHARMSTDEVEMAKGTIRDVASIKDMDLPPQERFEADVFTGVWLAPQADGPAEPNVLFHEGRLRHHPVRG